MKIRPIKSGANHEEALQEIEKLMDAKPGSAEGDRLEVLAALVNAYEAEHFPMELPDPIEAIKFRMEQGGLKRHDLEEALGGRNRVSEILNRKRPLTIAMIRNLARSFDIPTDILVREYSLHTKRTRKRRAKNNPRRAA